MAHNSLEELSVLMVVPSIVQGKILQKSIDTHGAVNIRQCKNIAEALSALDELKPDLVISSMYFDDGDGIDLVNTLRHDERFENILFMLVSSEERFEVIDPIRQAGVIAVLPKPFNNKDIQRALDKTVVYLSEHAEVNQHVNAQDMRVLVVDDSRLARRHLIKMLIKAGVQESHILQAEDGVLACDLLADNLFDVVLTDYNMPNMDGEELLVHIRQKTQQEGVPVIMVTSERSESKLESIQHNGVTALLDKPFDPQRLQHLLQTCI
ncbi:MAG: response regulator [Pseudomonadales bacterium]|nr:response regulator [Pseudomonadales bacterium]